MDSVTDLHASVGLTSNNDAKVLLGSDTEDDFYSVKGDFSRCCSVASSRRDSFSGSPSLNNEGDAKQIEDGKKHQDPSWNDRPKLFEFLQDECWSEEIASIHFSDIHSTAPGVKDDRLKSNQGIIHLSPSIPGEELKLADHNRSLKNEKAATANRCCFPSLSPRRSPRERKKVNQLD